MSTVRLMSSPGGEMPWLREPACYNRPVSFFSGIATSYVLQAFRVVSK